MARHGLIDGLQRVGAMLALMAVAVFVLLGQPAEARLAPEAPVAVQAGQAGDLDGGQHPPGAHCASHCAGHLAGLVPAPALAAAPASSLRYPPLDEIEPDALSAAPPTRPPAA